MFGTENPWKVNLISPQRYASLPDAINLVALLPVPVSTEGDLFAFVARIYDARPFYFHVWRPANKTRLFKLIASRRVLPSVNRDQHEQACFSVTF